jgi:hypothetical protein
MSPEGSSLPYNALVVLADGLFLECEDDVSCISRRLEELDPARRNELLVSDLLNAYQVFYFYFRSYPDDLVRERLELEPASSLIKGVKIDEVELLDLTFQVKNHEPVIVISDGEHIVSEFTGKKAYSQGMKYLENPPY